MPSPKIIHRPSKHGACYNRPKKIVVHAMGYQIDYDGERMYAASFLEHVGLSAHVLIAPGGELIRCRADHQGAWHAKGNNLESLGVEILVAGAYNIGRLQAITSNPYVTEDQYASLRWQIKKWCMNHDIESVVKHSDLDPNRRWFDPGVGLDWQRVQSYACG